MEMVIRELVGVLGVRPQFVDVGGGQGAEMDGCAPKGL